MSVQGTVAAIIDQCGRRSGVGAAQGPVPEGGAKNLFIETRLCDSLGFKQTARIEIRAVYFIQLRIYLWQKMQCRAP